MAIRLNELALEIELEFRRTEESFAPAEKRAKVGLEKCGCVKYGELWQVHDRFSLPACSPKLLAECYEIEMSQLEYDCPADCSETSISTVNRIQKK